MTPYLSRALALFLANPAAYLAVFANLLTVTALAACLSYILYRIFGGQVDVPGWLMSRFGNPLSVSGLPARVWRVIGLAGLVVVFIVMEM